MLQARARAEQKEGDVELSRGKIGATRGKNEEETRSEFETHGKPSPHRRYLQPVGRSKDVPAARFGVLELEKVVNVAGKDASQLHDAAAWMSKG